MKKAFTILELLVVVAIIAILSVAAVPSFIGRIQEAEAARELAELASVKKAIDTYHIANSSWPTLQGTDDSLGQAQPIFGSPHNIDFSRLVPDYLDKLPHFSYWWVDYTGMVYHTENKFVVANNNSITISENTYGKIFNSDRTEAGTVISGQTVDISGGKYLVLESQGRSLPIIGEEYKGEKNHPEAGYSVPSDEIETSTVNQSPVPKITITPETNITTDTDIEWGYTYTDAENDSILREEWEGKELKYPIANTYTVRLRIQDSANNWSDWVEKEIVVTQNIINISGSSIGNVTNYTEDNGGRKLVRASNGWLVAATNDISPTNSKAIILHVSKDNGETWNRLCWVTYDATSNLSGGFGIATTSNKVILVYQHKTGVYSNTIDIQTTADSDKSSRNKVIASSLTNNTAGISIAIHSATGDAHVAWSATSTPYSNSINILYSKSNNIGASWDTVQLLTTANTVNRVFSNPSIVVKKDGKPTVIAVYKNESTYRDLRAMRYNGSTWGMFAVESNTLSKPYSSPTATVDSLDNIHIAYVYSSFIAYYKCTNSTLSWSGLKLSPTSLDGYTQQSPSITVDNSDNVHVVWSGTSPESPSYSDIMYMKYSGTWESLEKITDQSSSTQNYANICDNFRGFLQPLLVWRDNNNTLRFKGSWVD